MKKYIFFILGLLFFINLFYAGEFFKTGESFFKTNNPTEAIPYFQKALTESPIEIAVYNYLGLAYYQTGQLQNALDTFIAGTVVTGTNKRGLYYNAGNAAFSLGQLDRAIELYSLALAADPSFSSAMLNRANAKLKKDSLPAAVEDYTKYLGLSPSSSQRSQVEALIAMLEVETENRKIEQERLIVEEQRIEAEKERIAEEKAKIEAEEAVRKLEEEKLAAQVAEEAAKKEAAKKAAEAERRRRLLEEVASSLQDASTQNVKAGSEGVMKYEHKSELD